LLLASIVVANIGGLITLYLNGINRLGILLTASLLRGISILAIGTVLFLYFGLAGFGMGILIGELFVQLVMVYYFIRYELATLGVKMPILSYAPITLSTVAVMMFLIGTGFEASFYQYLYPMALFSVIIAAFWGWNHLPHDVKRRLSHIMIGRFSKKYST
jgi:O-antigen/teichoic acid export membrane protein